MTIVGYVELSSEKEVSDLEIEIGKKYAALVGKPWPMPPDVVGPGTFPCGLKVATQYNQLTPAQRSNVFHQPLYTVGIRHEDGKGGIIAIDEAIEALPVVYAKVQRAQLSTKAVALLDARAAVRDVESVVVAEPVDATPVKFILAKPVQAEETIEMVIESGPEPIDAALVEFAVEAGDEPINAAPIELALETGDEPIDDALVELAIKHGAEPVYDGMVALEIEEEDPEEVAHFARLQLEDDEYEQVAHEIEKESETIIMADTQIELPPVPVPIPLPIAPAGGTSVQINTSPSASGSPGDAAQVQIINARATAWQMILPHAIEIFIVVCATWLRWSGKISEEMWAGAALYGGAGSIGSKLLGKKAVPTTTLLAMSAPSLLKGGAAAAAAKHLLTFLLAIVLPIAVLCTTVTGCVPFFAALPTVIAAATSVGEVLDGIESFITAHGGVTKEISQALIKARQALSAVMNTAKGAKDIRDQNLQLAIAEFQRAIDDVYALVGKYGVYPSDANDRMMLRGDDSLIVPSAAQLAYQLSGEQ